MLQRIPFLVKPDFRELQFPMEKTYLFVSKDAHNL